MSTLKEHLSVSDTDVVDLVLSNPKAQAVTASLTTGMAIDYNIMTWLPQSITVIGAALGLVLTSLMIYHKLILIRKDLKEL